MPSSVDVPLRPPQAVPSTTVTVHDPERDAGGPAVVLAPGAGTTAAHPLVSGVAERLAEAGTPVAVFDFGYAVAGRKAPDPLPRLEAAVDDVVTWASQRWPDRPLVLGGRSMGGRVASLRAAAGTPCAGLALLAYPLHPPGRREALRTAHWPDLRVPVLFVSGDRDAMADLALLEAERRQLAGPSEVVVLAGADHGWRVRAADGGRARDVVAEAVAALVPWLAALPSTGGPRRSSKRSRA